MNKDIFSKKNQLRIAVLNWFADYRNDLKEYISEEHVTKIIQAGENMSGLDFDQETIDELKYEIYGYLRINFAPEIGEEINSLVRYFQQNNEEYKDIFSDWRNLEILDKEIANLHFSIGTKDLIEDYLSIDEQNNFIFDSEIEEVFKKEIKYYIDSW